MYRLVNSYYFSLFGNIHIYMYIYILYIYIYIYTYIYIYRLYCIVKRVDKLIYRAIII